MMADVDEEKGLLGPRLKPHRRYGSTSVNMKKPDHIVVHTVNRGDTIQGIALKYGVTVEILKQHNKLWSAESIFLFDYLEIPLSHAAYESIIKDDPSIAQNLSPSTSPSLTNGTSSRESDTSSCSGSSSPNVHQQPSESKSPKSPTGLHDCSEKSSDDLLNKIDSSIALMKSNIEKMESYTHPMVDQMEVDDTYRRHKRHASDSNTTYPNCWGQQRYQNGRWKDPTLPPRTIVTNPSRTITMSLKRLLRDHEELYEL